MAPRDFIDLRLFICLKFSFDLGEMYSWPFFTKHLQGVLLGHFLKTQNKLLIKFCFQFFYFDQASCVCKVSHIKTGYIYLVKE